MIKKPTLCNLCRKYGHSEEECRKKKVTKSGSPKQREHVRKEKPEEQKEKQRVDIEEAGNQEKIHYVKAVAMTGGEGNDTY